MKALVFSPPHVELDADLAWLLRAAFADTLPDPCLFDPVRGLHLARSCELSGRIAKRIQGDGASGSSHLGALRRELDADYHANIAVEALLNQARDRIAQLARRLGIPLIAAKYAGLRLASVVTPGTRVACDLDLLLPRARAEKFWRALLAAGFQTTNTHRYAHQLEALVDPYGAVVDLHVHLPGVSVERGGFATAEQLIARGLVTRTSSTLLVPNHALLAAHAIAHGLLQNLATPQTYSPLRMISDIMDLRRVQPDVVAQAARYLSPAFRATCDALGRLSTRLAQGVLAGAGFEGTSEQTLLWHCIAARTEKNYSVKLRAAGLANKLRDGSSVGEVARYIADLFYPSAAALDALYGPAAGRSAQLRRRFFRPIDLAARALRRWAGSR